MHWDQFWQLHSVYDEVIWLCRWRSLPLQYHNLSSTRTQMEEGTIESHISQSIQRMNIDGSNSLALFCNTVATENSVGALIIPHLLLALPCDRVGLCLCLVLKCSWVCKLDVRPSSSRFFFLHHSLLKTPTTHNHTNSALQLMAKRERESERGKWRWRASRW